jgi:hypothetical protein
MAYWKDLSAVMVGRRKGHSTGWIAGCRFEAQTPGIWLDIPGRSPSVSLSANGDEADYRCGGSVAQFGTHLCGQMMVAFVSMVKRVYTTGETTETVLQCRSPAS